jgi:choline dehydrogenase-like flavoprotein
VFVSAGGFASDAYDCFVIGSGPAGVSLALALGEARKRVLIIESGDEEGVRADLANLLGYGHYGSEHWNAHSIRMLGGTSNVWAGQCPTPRHFDWNNPAVGLNWPIRRDELMPYWKRAAPILDHDPAFIDFERALLPGFLYRPVPAAVPTRIGVKYLPTLRTSRLVDVAPGRSVIGLDANDGRSAIARLRYVEHQSQAARQITIRPTQSVVVAAGGVGTPALLLQPRSDGGVPVGNESGLAGRFLMEHPEFDRGGECVLDLELDRYWPSDNKGRGTHAIIVDDEAAVEHGLYACSLQCSRKDATDPMARYFTSDLGRPFFHYQITPRCEMLPAATNQVFLTGERDSAGFCRPAARCVLDARDFLNVERTLRVFGERLIRLGRGRVKVNNDRIYKDVRGGGHIMGTTRMGQNRSTSVVDPECRVHGYDNFFVAGSSVFPTGGGYANPTLTIVALALRLADALARRR